MDEKRLWLAVLIQAIKDVAGFTVVNDARDRARVQHYARLWVDSDNHDLGSYLWICDELGISPSWLRRRMMTLISSDRMTKGGFGDQLSVSRAKKIANGLDRFDTVLIADLLT